MLTDGSDNDNVDGIDDAFAYIVVSLTEVSTGTQSIYTFPLDEFVLTPFGLINSAGGFLVSVYEFCGI